MTKKRAYKRNMKGKFEPTRGKKRILGILTVFAIAILGITGHLRGVEGAISGGNWTREVLLSD